MHDQTTRLTSVRRGLVEDVAECFISVAQKLLLLDSRSRTLELDMLVEVCYQFISIGGGRSHEPHDAI